METVATRIRNHSLVVHRAERVDVLFYALGQAALTYNLETTRDSGKFPQKFTLNVDSREPPT